MNQTKRVATTVIATVVLCLGGLGLLLSAFSFVVALGPATLEMPRSVLLVDAFLSVVSKLGLIAVGLSLLFRYCRTVVVTVAALAVSLTDTAYYLLAVVRPLAAEISGSQAHSIGVYFGATFVAVVAAMIYIGVLVYVTVPGTREEFMPEPPEFEYEAPEDQYVPYEE